jgi:hypothetical protein
MTSLTLLIIIVFLAGIYFYAKSTEGFTSDANLNRCPNLLIQKDSKFYLYNSKLAKVPGVNPVEFNNLEEYTEFLDWQRSQGIRCPVLYLQLTYDAQGNPVYKVRPSPNDLQGGLPPSAPYSKLPNPTLLVDATQSDRPYNINSYPAFDASSYYVGATTPLDDMNRKQESQGISPDPMDPNWGGADYTQSLVDQGYYAGNEVKLRV